MSSKYQQSAYFSSCACPDPIITLHFDGFPVLIDGYRNDFFVKIAFFLSFLSTLEGPGGVLIQRLAGLTVTKVFLQLYLNAIEGPKQGPTYSLETFSEVSPLLIKQSFASSSFTTSGETFSKKSSASYWRSKVPPFRSLPFGQVEELERHNDATCFQLLRQCRYRSDRK